MVTQQINLYENASVQGTLYFCVDESKFVVHFNSYVKIEMVLKEENANSMPLSTSNHAEVLLKSNEIDDIVKSSSNEKYQCQKKSSSGYIDLHSIKVDQTDNEQSIELCDSKDVTCETKEISMLDEIKKEKSSDDQDIIVKDETDLCLEISNAELDCDSKLNSVGNKGDLITHACSDCHDVFDSWRALRAHRQPFVTEEYACDQCTEVFQYKAYLQVHKQANHGKSGAIVVFENKEYHYKCDTCGTLVKSLIKLQEHTLIHFDEGLFKCCFCPLKFVERIDLKNHIKNHKNTGMIKCRKCNTWCENAADLGKHKLECREVKCYICNIDFPNRTSRNLHYKDFHPNDILKCHLCSYLFSSQEELDNHIANHSLSKKTQCPICGQFFSRLKRHMLSHKKRDDFTEKDLYFCDKCPAKFKNQVTFSRHRKKHSSERLYKCTYCPKSFRDCTSLRSHLQRHKRNPIFSCEICNENYSSKTELECHMLTHLNEQNIIFPCSLCSDIFLGKDLLDSHMITRHSDSVALKSNSIEIISNAKTAAASVIPSSSTTISQPCNTNTILLSNIQNLCLENGQIEVIVLDDFPKLDS